MNEVLKIRLDFLKLEVKGFFLCGIMKTLSKKYQSSERNIHYDVEICNT